MASNFNPTLESNSVRQILESLAIPFCQYPAICGIDEAGRGCIAGSLFVCGVVLKNPPDRFLSQLKDSKVLSQITRDSLAEQIKQYTYFHLVQTSADMIDAKGLSVCIRDSLLEILSHLNAPFYVFDGSCNFKIDTLKTLVKGDSKLYAISAASILAKSAKDAEMLQWHEKYPQYDFAHNKGYGTKAHLNAIKKYGFCAIHRKSYHIKSLSNLFKLCEK
ncbi:ribonuclease HII [uncultured Helicobacter sp.]|uniref:ribonuclease HII n=1 Tax=uncultured Helicobacter sp. TaxID=175537 RepID=UPI00344D48F3